MYATIVVESNYVEEALQIPANALYSDREGFYVYKKKDKEKKKDEKKGEDENDGKDYERVNVKIGTQTVTAVEITEGLKEGDEIYVKP